MSELAGRHPPAPEMRRAASAKAGSIRKPRNDTAAPSATNAGMKSHAEHAAGGRYSRSEEADDYHALVARLNDSWRVIVCAAGIQWILQRRCGERFGTARWEGRSYCRTGEALKRLSRRHAGAIDPTVAAILLASLPERIENVHRKAVMTPRTISASTVITINIDTS
jgi:hypothetical protein